MFGSVTCTSYSPPCASGMFSSRMVGLLSKSELGRHRTHSVGSQLGGDRDSARVRQAHRRRVELTSRRSRGHAGARDAVRQPWRERGIDGVRPVAFGARVRQCGPIPVYQPDRSPVRDGDWVINACHEYRELSGHSVDGNSARPADSRGSAWTRNFFFGGAISKTGDITRSIWVRKTQDQRFVWVILTRSNSG